MKKELCHKCCKPAQIKKWFLNTYIYICAECELKRLIRKGEIK
jgi:hypothetical protein